MGKNNLLSQRLHSDELQDEVKKKKEKPIKEKPVKEKIIKEKKTKTKNNKIETTVITAKSKDQLSEENIGAAENLDKELEEEIERRSERFESNGKSTKRNYYIFKVVLCVLCGYLLFLIYGALMTDYDYDEKGNVTAQRMSVEDIKQQKEFNTLLGYYMDARALYEKILSLNYQLDKNENDALKYASEYEKLLDESSKIIIQVKAVTPSKQYSQAYSLLLNWVNADLSSYLQEISKALTTGNSENLQNAMNDKQRCYNNCHQLTANIISLGQNIKGVNLSDVKDWSPEIYIQKEMGLV
ncbi:MAG: hypothetical protein K6F27_10150 [Ruminococcus sp.]|nr:hypothetical protein [Ruminococcus sp.]